MLMRVVRFVTRALLFAGGSSAALPVPLLNSLALSTSIRQASWGHEWGQDA